MRLTSFEDNRCADFQAEVRAWLSNNIPEAWRTRRHELNDDDVAAVRRAWDRLVFEGGYSGLTWPAEHGGRGAGPVEEFLYYEAAADLGAPEGFGRVGRLLAGPTIIEVGTPEQKSRFLPPILDGREVWCQGFSEPGSGSDLASVSTTARDTGSHFVVSGQKVWTSYATDAALCLLLVRTGEPGDRHKNLTMLLVDMDSPGLTIRPIKQITGRSEFAEVFFDDVSVPKDRVLGCVSGGWGVAMTVLKNERGTVDAVNKHMELVEAVRLLEHCGLNPGELAEFRAKCQIVSWQVKRAIESDMRHRPSAMGTAAILKLYWSELLQELTSRGVEVACGEHAATWREMYLESRATSVYSGTSEIQRNIIAERVLGLPRGR